MLFPVIDRASRRAIYLNSNQISHGARYIFNRFAVSASRWSMKTDFCVFHSAWKRMVWTNYGNGRKSRQLFSTIAILKVPSTYLSLKDRARDDFCISEIVLVEISRKRNIMERNKEKSKDSSKEKLSVCERDSLEKGLKLASSCLGTTFDHFCSTIFEKLTKLYPAAVSRRQLQHGFARLLKNR